MPRFQAMIVTLKPQKKGEHDHEAPHIHYLSLDAEDEDAARKELDVRAAAEQSVRCQQTGQKVLTGWTLVKVAPE